MLSSAFLLGLAAPLPGLLLGLLCMLLRLLLGALLRLLVGPLSLLLLSSLLLRTLLSLLLSLLPGAVFGLLLGMQPCLLLASLRRRLLPGLGLSALLSLALLRVRRLLLRALSCLLSGAPGLALSICLPLRLLHVQRLALALLFGEVLLLRGALLLPGFVRRVLRPWSDVLRLRRRLHAPGTIERRARGDGRGRRRHATLFGLVRPRPRPLRRVLARVGRGSGWNCLGLLFGSALYLRLRGVYAFAPVDDAHTRTLAVSHRPRAEPAVCPIT